MAKQTATTPGTPGGLVARFLENVRLVKSLRKLDDEALAQAGGYRSRQVLNARLTGRTAPDLEDVARIAAALNVAPEVMFLPAKDLFDWLSTAEGKGYKPPRLPNRTRTRTNRTGANTPSAK